MTALLLADSSFAAPQPWTHQAYDDRREDFTFAVISDLAGGERAGIFDVAVEDLNLLRPAFVMSVGDLIEGVTLDEKEVIRQWENFDLRAKKIIPPFFYVVGNHDISNTVMRRIWEQRLGRRYYHFVYKNVLFMAVDSEDFPPQAMDEKFTMMDTMMKRLREGNATLSNEPVGGPDWEGTMDGAISDEQVAYFKKALADNPKVRWTFIFLHRPLWQGAGNPGLQRIEAAIPSRRFMTFAGHTHNYSFFEEGEQIHIRLGTTGASWVSNDTKDNFDHLMLVRMTKEGPYIANLKLDGILDKKGQIPANGEKLCFSETACKQKAAR